MDSVACDTVLDSIPDMISVQDADQVIVRANRAFKKRYGMKDPAGEGEYCYKVVHGMNEPCAVCPHIRALSTGSPAQKEYFDEEEGRYYDVICTPVADASGRPAHTIHVMRDITEHRKAEEETLYREKLKSVIETAGAACHELNQPLQAVLGFSDLLSRKLPKDAEAGKWVLKIRDQVERMAEITRKLNNITRYEVQEYLAGMKIVDLKRSSE